MYRGVVVFDLDDTLYKEIDYLKSAYREISDRLVRSLGLNEAPLEKMIEWYHSGENVFSMLRQNYGEAVSTEDCLDVYRNPIPSISMAEGVAEMLRSLLSAGYILGIITDGRELTQRNKLRSLGLDQLFSEDDIIISESFGSEKPAERNYQYFMDRYPKGPWYYVGDNVEKDFVAPNRLGWRTICLLDDGSNIHSQTVEVALEYQPSIRISSLSQLPLYL